MQIDEGHASREGSDGVCGPVLRASFARSLHAELNNGANISLNDLRERGIVLFVFRSIRMIRLHENLRSRLRLKQQSNTQIARAGRTAGGLRRICSWECTFDSR